MLFYKIHCELAECEVKENHDEKRRSRRDSAYKIAAMTADFNRMEDRFFFLSEMNDEFATLGAICRLGDDVVGIAKKFIKKLVQDAALKEPEEITLATVENLLSISNRAGYVEDDDEILARFGLDKLGRRARLEFGENLSSHTSERDELIAKARKLFTTETLVPELERIYSGSRSPSATGHPVHYIVECDERDTRREIYKVILDALYASHRLKSRRYAFLDFHPMENYSQMAYEFLYKVSDGGAVVVRYIANDDSEEETSASTEREIIENICEMAKRFRNKVLTVFCFPRECKKIKSLFYENLGTMSLIEIKEDFVAGDTAKDFLKALAKERHVRSDKNLLSEVECDRSYLAPELVSVFEEWYNTKLKTSVYPQYKNVTAVRRETLKEKPRGTAFGELDEMIGLSDAKAVIKKALNYYKMQKLYKERGIKQDNPAMHMIFTGNPGTAKTTVARLFARIMRENGLLSRGQLVEVGRGDLVGKYVGWTAQTVQAKFREASGGVLFIDEAYSLVDDRNGSYGDEAINTIVQEMENHRADVVVIFAGYPDKMEKFIEKNPGLRSRIAFHVPFADYTSKELCSIAELISKKNGMKIEDGALDKLEKAFDLARVNVDFGNGRYVRNVFEQARMSQASRLLEKDFDSITAEEIATITADDITLPDLKKNGTKKIGF